MKTFKTTRYISLIRRCVVAPTQKKLFGDTRAD
jgi:hypothetical protein